MVKKLRITMFIKMLIAFFLSFFIAKGLGIDHPFTSGVIGVLALGLTIEQVVQNAYKRLLISLFGIGIASLTFFILGINWYALLIVILLLLVFAYFLKLEVGVVLALVLIGHIFNGGEKYLSFSLNSIYILILNVTIAFLFNLYMPAGSSDMIHIKRGIEQLIRGYFKDIYEGKEIDFTPYDKQVKDAKATLFLIKENTNKQNIDKNIDYIIMRESQIAILRAITPILKGATPSIYKSMLLDYMYLYHQRIGEENYAAELKIKLDELLNEYKALPIPLDRQEFEERAQLFHVLVEMEHFLDLKINYHQKWE